jgi:tryptophan synthase alpha chain
VQRIRRYTNLPVAVGFGISTAEQVAAVGKYAEAAVVGSAVMQVIENFAGSPVSAVGELIHRLRPRGAEQGYKVAPKL